MNKRYSIDVEQGTITFTPDLDTSEQETRSLDELLELLFWMKGREQDIRSITWTARPIDIRQPLRLVNGFYVGTCDDRRLVKVRAEAVENMLKSTEARVRANWLFDRKEEAQYKAGPVAIEQLDKDGKPMYPPAENVTEADTPDFLVQDALYKIRQVEFWVDRPENLSLGRYAKTL